MIELAEIARIRDAYAGAGLRARLACWRDDVDTAFHGWNGIWLDPAFRAWDIAEEFASIRVPILIIQGEDDQYGTVRQVEAAREACDCPVEVALLPAVRHVPHREAPEATERAITEFTLRLLRDHHEGVNGPITGLPATEL